MLDNLLISDPCSNMWQSMVEFRSVASEEGVRQKERKNPSKTYGGHNKTFAAEDTVR